MSNSLYILKRFIWRYWQLHSVYQALCSISNITYWQYKHQTCQLKGVGKGLMEKTENRTIIVKQGDKAKMENWLKNRKNEENTCNAKYNAVIICSAI
jgi:hypothetical protein